MMGIKLNSSYPPGGGNDVAGFECSIMLMKDWKPICRTRCLDPPIQMPSSWSVSDIVRTKHNDFVSGLPQCILLPTPENFHQQKEWERFMGFLMENKKVAIAKVGSCDFYISPPSEGSKFGHAVVLYRTRIKQDAHKGQKHGAAGIAAPATLTETTKLVKDANAICGLSQPGIVLVNTGGNFTNRSDTCITSEIPAGTTDRSSDQELVETIEDSRDRQLRDESSSKADTAAVKRQSGPLKSNFVQAHPSYLKTLGQAHSGWIFGAIAELVDNSRDAKSTRLEISIDMVFSKTSGEDIPMLSVIDDGHGMTHQDIQRMISLGHQQPNADDSNRIGRFGIGFKTGAMRLGKDALVLSQTDNSRSIALLSQSFNEGKDSLEIPIVSYQRRGQFMDVDTHVQSKVLAKSNLKAIKEFSPFNKYLIGEKAGLFHEKGTGTQIYIWNLDKWGSDYCLEWQNGKSVGSYFHQGDVLIRSKRIRTRPGQTSRVVPLDYSLQSYLEVIFLDPRMKIYMQGSLVRSRPLAKSLNRTVVENGSIMGKPIQLIIGRCQLEWEQANCGIFLYWRGRLIEAYKRVGGMVHCADIGRGVIGVMDVTDLMEDTNGQAWVHNNKQGFQDSELYAQLEDWLGDKFNQYWDTNFDALELRKGSALYKPDHDWVQCNKCRKWRMLSSGFDSKQLPLEWFCYMDPFHGKCEMPEEKVEPGVITMSTKRTGHSKQNFVECQDALLDQPTGLLQGCSDCYDLPQMDDVNVKPGLKRFRRSHHRSCKKP